VIGPPSDGSPGTTVSRGLLVVLAFVVVVTYVALHDIYRPENHDDACSLSYAYSYVHHGITHDVHFGNRMGGQNGVSIAGRIWARIYGHTLDAVGWTRGASHRISIAFMVASAFVWFGIVRRLTGSATAALTFALLFLLLEPFFAAANQARPDAMTLLLASSSFLLFLHHRAVLAGVLAVAAFETHPMGLVAGVFVLAYGLAAPASERGAFVRALPRVALGGLIGIAGYVAMYRPELGELGSVLWGSAQGTNEPTANFLYEYFFRTKYLRHLPELLLLAGVVFVQVRRGYFRENRFPLILLGLAIAVSVVVRRPNFMYTVYVYPAILFVMVATFHRMDRLSTLVVIFLGLLVPQYAVVWWQNRHHDLDDHLETLRALAPAGEHPIVGSPNAWFVFKDRGFYCVSYASDFLELELEEFILIDGPPTERYWSPAVKATIGEHYTGELLAEDPTTALRSRTMTRISDASH
jgi:hypothetical protein